MEEYNEEYDVLGNFKDLKNIFKNIPSALPTSPLQEAASAKTKDTFSEDSFDEADILGEIASNLPKKKNKPSTKTANAKKNQKSTGSDPDFVVELESSPKKKQKSNKQAVEKEATRETEPNNLTAQNQGVAYRTRRSLRSSSVDIQNSNSADNAPDTSLNRGQRAKRGKNKTADTNSTPTMDSTLLSARGRGRKNKGNNSTRGRRNNNVQTLLETISMNMRANSSSTQRLNLSRNVMRARREFIAEQAARCPTVGVVDLVTSPSLPMPTGVIDLEAEEEDEAEKFDETKQLSLDLSFDEDNPEISIKINWQFKLEVFKLRKYQKFSKIFQQLAERENIEVDQVFLNINNQIIKPDDTPASIDYKVYQFIEGRAMNPIEYSGTGAIPKKKRDPNVIKLKVQSDKFKKPLIIELNKTENFRKLVIKCAEELQIPYENITKLSFDGETLDYQQTPVDLELEGGEIIEIHLKA